MRHENQREAQLAPQAFEQLQHDRLHRYIEGGGGFVEDQQVGLHRQGARNAHPGLLTSRELMRVARQQFGGQAHLVGEFGHAGIERRTAQPGQQPEWLADRVSSGKPGIQAVGRILEHHLDAGALGTARKPRSRHRADLAAVKHDPPVSGIVQSRKQSRKRGLAAARFAHQAHAFAPTDHKRYIIDRVQHRSAGTRHRKILAQALDLQQGGSGWRLPATISRLDRSVRLHAQASCSRARSGGARDSSWLGYQHATR